MAARVFHEFFQRSVLFLSQCFEIPTILACPSLFIRPLSPGILLRASFNFKMTYIREYQDTHSVCMIEHITHNVLPEDARGVHPSRREAIHPRID